MIARDFTFVKTTHMRRSIFSFGISSTISFSISISPVEVIMLMCQIESRLITNFLFGLITIMVSFHVYIPVCLCAVLMYR